MRSVGSPGYESEEDREVSEECGESRFGSVTRTRRTVRCVGNPAYGCEKDRKDSVECGEYRL